LPGIVKIPEGIVKAKDIMAEGDRSTDVASEKPVTAKGFNVDESKTKIPEGIMKPKEASGSGNPNVPGDPAAIAAGELVDASGKKPAEDDARIPLGVMKSGPMS
jgi:hypothetical protein